MKPVTVYGRKEFQDLDIGAIMRQGHPDIRDGDEYIVSLVEQHCIRLGRPPVVIEVGCGSGVLSAMLADRIPDAKVVANEIEPNLVELARRRLAKSRTELFSRPFDEWDRPFDILVSWGSHHHLSNVYLNHAKELLSPEGVFILGDEFCPEYCNAEDAARIAAAESIHIAGGYVLTSQAELEAYNTEKIVPPEAIDLERRRQWALWRWYKYVIDYAMARGNLTVVLAELQIARDDLTTGFGGEHKLSPLIIERDFELRGFQRLSKCSLGSDAVELQSFFIYEFAPMKELEYGK